MSYAIYNIGTKILQIKPGLYSNSQPHRPNPNSLWSKTLSLFTKTPPQNIDNLTFKSLYQTLHQPDSNPIPLLNTAIPHTWLRLTHAKLRPSLFSNLEKKISFKTAYKGYNWGYFFFKQTSNPETLTTFLAKSVSLLLMILIIFSSSALLLVI